MNEKNEKNICFIIAPIGQEKSDIREKSDKVLNYIIKPVITNFDYELIRSDKISKPGIITNQIIQHILDDELVIADLTGYNPNVFYELAVRHATKKPCIQMIEKGQEIPFDVTANRTIKIDVHDIRVSDEAKKELEKQIKSIEKNPDKIDNPISTATDLDAFRKGEDSSKRLIADIYTQLSNISIQINEVNRKIQDIEIASYSPSYSPGIEELRNAYTHAMTAIPLSKWIKADKEKYFNEHNALIRRLIEVSNEKEGKKKK